jgi:hypothetical protein
LSKDEPIYLSDIKSDYSDDPRLRHLVETRGVARSEGHVALERLEFEAA